MLQRTKEKNETWRLLRAVKYYVFIFKWPNHTSLTISKIFRTSSLVGIIPCNVVGFEFTKAEKQLSAIYNNFFKGNLKLFDPSGSHCSLHRFNSIIITYVFSGSLFWFDATVRKKWNIFVFVNLFRKLTEKESVLKFIILFIELLLYR